MFVAGSSISLPYFPFFLKLSVCYLSILKTFYTHVYFLVLSLEKHLLLLYLNCLKVTNDVKSDSVVVAFVAKNEALMNAPAAYYQGRLFQSTSIFEVTLHYMQYNEK